MAARLLRHRRAILLGVVAAYLIVGAWQWENDRSFTVDHVVPTGLRVFGHLLPRFGALFVGVAGLIAVLVARATSSEPLDRRPTHAALTGVSLIWISVFLVVMGGTVSAFASAIAGTAFLVGALVDWLTLFSLLRSRMLIEHREAGVVAPPVVSGMATPVALCEPANANYRENAIGKPVVAVPVDRAAARNRLAAQVVVALACAFVALPGGVLAAMPILRDEPMREDWPSKLTSPLAGSSWRGRIDYGGHTQYEFTLTIEDAHDGRLSGVMDWGDVAANIEGTYDGDELVFYDRSIRRTNGARFNLNDRKDVRIIDERMLGTDKNGLVPLYATRVR